MCSFPVGTAPLLTIDSTFVSPITGKGPPFRRLQSTNEAPRLFMLTDDNSLLSSSSDLLSLLPECSHLTSFDLIPSTPPRTVSLGLDTANQQVLHRKFEDVQLDAVTLYICNVGFGGAGKGDRWGHYHTPRGPAARTKESPGTLKAASDVRTTAFDVVQKFPLNNFNESSEDVFIRGKTTDKITKNEDYTQGQEGHHPQSPSPSSGDAVLSCWETGSQFSYHG
ncbi:hypothetical protein F5876DRAFT_71406, partial [Lentinula aff. lateritia]